MKLKGKVAVITGGNSGIGLATAQEFKTHGAEVVIFGRTQKVLEEAVQTIGIGTFAVRGDVTNLADLDRLYQRTVERFGNVDRALHGSYNLAYRRCLIPWPLRSKTNPLCYLKSEFPD